MAVFAPHYSLFTVINTLRKFLKYVFWIIFIISLIPTVTLKFNVYLPFEVGIKSVNIILITAYFVIEILIDYILLPMADSKRRDDFLDNSLGSTLAIQPSVGYYDNDEIIYGIYKCAVNLFQNCFTTYSLVKRVTLSTTIIPVFGFVILLFIAYTGFDNNTFALSVLQTLFSATIFGNFIKHFILLTRLNTIEASWVAIFSDPGFKINPEIYQAKILKNWLAYETLHSKIPAEIPKKIYERLNPSLTNEWIQMKSRYNIN